MKNDKILDFKKRMKEVTPENSNFVIIMCRQDGENAVLEHSENLNGYEVLGMLEYAKMLKLAECDAE
jgi:hypothetical protein